MLGQELESANDTVNRVAALLLLCGVALCSGQTEPLIISFSVAPMPTHPPSVGTGYAVTQTNVFGAVEYRCYLHGHHFLSVINADGAFVLRPHPGVDRNGWGSSLYLQPFLSAPGVILGHTCIGSVVPTADGVFVSASGGVSGPYNTTYGTWDTALFFGYDPTNKVLTGSGTYAINLAGRLSDAAGDLNLYKLASNLLTNVPVLSGGVTNTGDMSAVHVLGSNSTGVTAFEWVPVQAPAHCPGDQFDRLCVTVLGEYNQVDTAAQGLCPIEAACKPTASIELVAQESGIPLIFCGFYAINEATNFAADNIGINAVVLKSTLRTNFSFLVSLESTPIAQDGIGVEATLTVAFAGGVPELGVFYTPALSLPFNRLVGWLPWCGSNVYHGSVRVPFAPAAGQLPQAGYFRVGVPSCE